MVCIPFSRSRPASRGGTHRSRLHCLRRSIPNVRLYKISAGYVEVLDGVSDLAGRHAHRSYGSLLGVVLRESDHLAPRAVVVCSLSWHRLETDVCEAATVQG